MTIRRTGKQVLSVHEPSTGLPETLRRFLLAESKNIDALVTDAGGKSGKITVRGNQTKSIEPAAMKQVHCIDDQRDVGCIFPGGVGKLLLRYDGVLR
jgi:hypothetical protein